MTYTEAQKQLIKDWPFSRKVKDEDLHRGAMMLNDEIVNANDLILQDKNNGETKAKDKSFRNSVERDS